MGNGALRRYKKEEENDFDPNDWRKPKQRKGARPKAPERQAPKVPAKAVSPESSGSTWRAPRLSRELGVESTSASTTPPPAAASALSDRSPPSHALAVPSRGAALGLPATDRGFRSASPTASPAPADDDDDDLAEFGNLADVAASAWEELMSQKNTPKEFGQLFVLGELKDSVERAAKRCECLRREAAVASSRFEEKKTALEDLCGRLEERALPNSGASVPWKLGDLALRRGKGVCELSMVHHLADPPYFEVRMAVTGSVAGTEANNLVPMTQAQQTNIRGQLRELEQAKAMLAKANVEVEKAHEELKAQHQVLTEQVEKRLIEQKPASASGSSMAGRAARRGAPPGMPDLGTMRQWAGGPNEPDSPPVEPYPDMKGFREDLRSDEDRKSETGTTSASTTFPTTNSATGREAIYDESSYRHHSQRKMSQTPDGAGGCVPTRETTNVPAGFPKLDAQTTSQSTSRPARHLPTQMPIRQPKPRPQAQPQTQAQSNPQPEAQAFMQGPQQPQAAQPSAEWVVYRTAEGQAYYHNEVTNETVWTLPVGARCREPGASGYQDAQQSGAWAQGQAGVDDPFAELRRREEEMRQQREGWAQWYQQYNTWYQQQAQAQAQAYAQASAGGAAGATPAGSPPMHGSGRQNVPHFGRDTSDAAGGGTGAGGSGGPSSSSQARVPPRGPAPPKLDAAFEDHALYALKSTVLKEMEAMVDKGAPVAQRKKALRCLQIRWHPDKNPEKIEAAKSVFQFIEETKGWFLFDPDAETSCA